MGGRQSYETTVEQESTGVLVQLFHKITCGRHAVLMYNYILGGLLVLLVLRVVLLIEVVGEWTV
jgi:hypothetical protein